MTLDPVDDVVSSTEGVRPPRTAGFATRQSGDAGCLWQEIAEYADGRVGVVIGSCADTAEAQRLRIGTGVRLRGGEDPSAVVGGTGSSAVSVLAAVIDRTESQMSYASVGGAAPAVTTPGQPHQALDSTDGRVALVPLSPGAVVVLSTGKLTGVAPLRQSDVQALDDLLAGFTAQAGRGVVVVLYHHPPSPLYLIVPAEPDSLAVIRRRLRGWLATTGVDDETSADILLAVGEAATNAAEHAHDGTGRLVQIAVRAESTADALRFTVSDNGSWKTPTESNAHRGHGMRLMNALLDSVDVNSTAQGTTIEMLKKVAG